jgi:hypothetical protein
MWAKVKEVSCCFVNTKSWAKSEFKQRDSLW